MTQQMPGRRANKSAAVRNLVFTVGIPVAAKRCPECTAHIVPGTEQPQPTT